MALSKNEHQIFGLEYFKEFEHGKGNPILGLGEGDSGLYLNVLPDNEAEEIFTKLKDEVLWGRMRNKTKCVQRLVAIQGSISSSNGLDVEPLYRHPADEQPPLHPWTESVDKIRNVIQSNILKNQPLNHCLIQLYRSGKDLISEHADKTLDIKKGTFIVNYSSGASRVMVLRSKDPIRKEGDKNIYQIQKVTLPHNSVFILGWETNLKWKHAINQDKRIDVLKRPDELAYDTQRISLTFRHVDTFLREDGKIFGQGGIYKSEDELKDGKEEPSQDEQYQESLRLLKAFSAENRESDFNWEEHYGKGFDILNFKVLKELEGTEDN